MTSAHQNPCRYRVEHSGQAFYYDDLREALSEFQGEGGHWVIYNQRTGDVAAASIQAMKYLGLDKDDGEE